MKKYISKLMPVLGLCTLFSFGACSDDKGNYSYADKNVLTIENIPAMTSLLADAEYVDLKPIITSSTEGVITADNPNYSFSYKRKNSEDKWVEMGTAKDLYMLANLSSGTHRCYFSVTDNRTGVQTVYPFNIKATTITSEGWMVLCNEGSEERARMDMLSQISLGRIIPTHDVIRTSSDVPAMYHATSIGYLTSHSKLQACIIMFSETGAYLVPTEGSVSGPITTMTAVSEFKLNQFLASTTDHVINYVSTPALKDYYCLGRPVGIICVSKEGNAYATNLYSKAPAPSFEYPINTSKRGEAPQYKVSPYIGASLLRYDGLGDVARALLYDTDNKRFIGWSNDGVALDDPSGVVQKLIVLENPESEKKFDFQTGMDIVCMLNTARSDGAVYTILQDGNKRHVYSIGLSEDFKQLNAYMDIQAPDFDKATCFAASSQYAVIYYAYKNKIYSYNLESKASQSIALDANEEVTLLKFNRYDDPMGTGSGIGDSFLKGMDEETQKLYIARQNDLIVGSYDNSATDNNGGILR